MAEDRRPTILHVISSLGEFGGGAERQLVLYLQHRSARWRHVVAYRKPHHLLRDAIEQTGARTVWLGKGSGVRHIARLVRLGREESVAMIHSYLWEANAVARLAGRILRRPVITTLTNTFDVEDRIALGEYDPWKFRVGMGIETLTARLATRRFIAISETVKQSAAKNIGIPLPRITVVYRAVRGDGPNGARPPHAAPVLITTGRLVRHKGHDLLLRMFKRVLRVHPECTLQIVGDGKNRQELERLAGELGVAQHVQFRGLRADVAQLLRQADVYVYGSWFEGFANAFAEAIAAGLPVVAVDLPVFREIAPHTSVQLVPRDEQAFSDAVLQVLAALDQYREIARQESIRFQERFSIAQYVEGTEAVYAEAIEAGR